MMVLDATLIWAGVLLLIRPRNSRSVVATAFVGSVIVASGPAQDTIMLAQLSAWAFAGLALLVYCARRNPAAVWLPALAVRWWPSSRNQRSPSSYALAILQCWPVLVRAATIVVVASLPGAAVFSHNAGSLSAAFHTAADNLHTLERLPTNDLASRNNIRIDGLGIAPRFQLPALTGIGWAVAAFLVATVLLLVLVRALGCKGLGARRPSGRDRCIRVRFALSFIHLSYDQVLLYVGPLAAFGLVLEHRADVSARALAIGGAVLVAFGFAFRAGFRTRMADAGLSALRVRQAWVTVPTLFCLALVSIAVVVRERASASEAQAQARPHPN